MLYWALSLLLSHLILTIQLASDLLVQPLQSFTFFALCSKKSWSKEMEWWAILLIVLAVCLIITRCCCKLKSTDEEEASNDDGNPGSSQPTHYSSQPPMYGSQPPVYGSQPPNYGSGNFSSPPPAYSNADGSSPHHQNFALPSTMPPLNAKMAPPSYPPSYEESLHMWLNSWLLNKVITDHRCIGWPRFQFYLL